MLWHFWIGESHFSVAGRAQYNDEADTETYVPLYALAMLTDAEFCQEAAVSLDEYNVHLYMKT